MNAPIPVGLIGLGRHGRRYFQHLLEEETGGQLVAISRLQVDEGQKMAAHHGLRFFPDYRDLIADPAIHAVLVVTPPALHVQITLEAIAAGKAVLVEKPLALHSRAGKQMVDAANHAGIPLMTGHTLRYEPVIRKIQDIAPHLGSWQILTGTMHLEERPDTKKIQDTTHGVVLEFGIHLLDWVHVMIPGERLTLSAHMPRASSDAHEEHAEINLTTGSGLPCHLNIARVNATRTTHLEITGTNGRVQGNWTTGIVETWKQDTRISRDILPKTPTLVTMLKEFFHALQTDTPVPITGEDGLRAVEWAEACYQAAQTGQTVSVT